MQGGISNQVSGKSASAEEEHQTGRGKRGRRVQGVRECAGVVEGALRHSEQRQHARSLAAQMRRSHAADAERGKAAPPIFRVILEKEEVSRLACSGGAGRRANTGEQHGVSSMVLKEQETRAPAGLQLGMANFTRR